MKTTKLLAIVATIGVSPLTMAAENPSDGKIAAEIVQTEGRVNWHLSDGTEFHDVKVAKTTDGSWVEIEYTRPVRRVPTREQAEDTESNAPRFRCWINVGHVTRIVPIENRTVAAE